MKIVVCIRQGLDGEINPFDACAYEAALRIDGSDIILLSMGPVGAGALLQNLTRLGAKKAILLSDKHFAGADTLATAYTLSRAINKLSPDLVLCGRQTLVGDTAQTGAMLSTMSNLSLITNVMSIDNINDIGVRCTTRTEGTSEAAFPALLTIERINTLRLPRLRSKLGEFEIWNASDIDADVKKCGLSGSPTRVVQTFENQSGKRKCKFISKDSLQSIIDATLKKEKDITNNTSEKTSERLANVCIIGEAPLTFAESISDIVTEIPLTDADKIASEIRKISPDAVLWGSDTKSKRLSAVVAAKMELGLCADCTQLECENGNLIMYRPALSGSIIAKIKSLRRPAMATVRTEIGSRQIIVAAGFGVKDTMDSVKLFADSLSAELCVSRKLVDNGYAKYELQVGLTGKTVSPPVYIAIGISGAIHHIVGMQRAGTIIAINPDPNAPIFEYADYGIIEKFEQIC